METTAPNTGRDLAAGGHGRRRGRLPWHLLLAGALLLGLAFALGWAASVAWSSLAPFRVVEQVAGTVSVVNAPGDAFCLEPDGGGRQRCGVPYQPRDAPSLEVGDRVTVAIGLLRVDGAAEQEAFVIVAVE